MTKRGRPLGEAKINHEVILLSAFEMLSELGPNGLSMRGLAARLNVTPMAIYNHFPDRSVLIREMSDVIYAKVVGSIRELTGHGQSKAQHLLLKYYQTCVQYPNLTLLIFTTHEDFSKELRQINFHLSNFLSEAKITSIKKKMWQDVLIDFTHGSAMAVATSRDLKILKSQSIKYQQQLKVLLECIFNSSKGQK